MTSATDDADQKTGILIIAGDLPSLVHHRLHILKRLALEGYRLQVIAGGGEADLSALDGLDVRIERRRVERLRVDPIADARLFWEIFSRVGSNRPPRLVQALALKSMLMTKLAIWLAARLGRPVPGLVLSFAGLGRGFDEAGGVLHRLRRRLIVALVNLGARRLPITVTVENASDRERLRRHGVADTVPIRLIRGTGVDLDLYRPNKRTGPVRVLFAGRLLRAKGAGLYLEMVRVLAPLYPDVRFELAGVADPNDPDSIGAAEVADLVGRPNFAYLGLVPSDQMPVLLARTDLVCLPSRYGEGVPRILMEAAASGCAFLASPMPGWTDIVGQNPDSGWLVAAHSVTELADGIAEALADPEALRIRGARARSAILAANVSERDVQDGFLAVFVDLCGQKAAR